MKNIILGIALLLVLGCGNRSENKTDLEKENVFGKIKSIKTAIYTAHKYGEVQEKNLQESQSAIYDTEGRITELTKKIEDGYAYEPGTFFEKITYEYDKGLLVKEISEGNFDEVETFKRTTIYKYNDKGKLLEDATTDSLFKAIYKYDDKDNKIGKNIYREGGLSAKILYQYDDEGNIIEEKWDNGDKTTYKYDKKGNKIEEERGDSIGSFGKSTYKYDDEGNITEICQYSPKGELVSKETTTYEYDQKGNWIKCINYENNNPKTITKRQIDYY